MGQKALLVIDMLNDFLLKDGALFCGEKSREIIPFVKETIEEFRKNGHLVLYIRDAHKKDDPEFRLFRRHCVAGTKGAEVIDEIKPQAGDMQIPKTTYDGYYDSDLGKVLREKNIKEVYLTGVCTSICVMETASSLAKRGYSVYIYTKGAADFDQRAHDFALKRTQTIYGAKLI